jgi:autotransporter-associated beta strand protein
MPATDVTVGQLTIDNTNDQYATKITMANNGGGRLVFEDPSGTAKYIETANGTPGNASQNVQNSIQMPILVKNTLEITQQNYPNLNTGTIFTNRFDGDVNSVIIKKGTGGIQLQLNSAPGAGFGFLGQILIQEGPVRLINKTFAISSASGITVSSGGQLQLADNATAVPDYNIASGAVLNLNGNGAAADGALRFGTTVAGRTETFHNSVNLQTDSHINVALAGTFGVIDKAVTGGGDLIKTGSGQLTLTAANSNTGDTQINAGTLSVTNATLADGADVSLSTGAKFDLGFSGSDTIRSLFFGGVAQSIGTWGATGSGATNINDTFFTGTGTLNVTTVPAVGVPGDYNGNGVVDMADYVLWRSGGPLQNEVATTGSDTPEDYTEWRARFGNTMGSGSALGAAAVPEPSTVMLLVFISQLFVSRKLGRKRS